MKLLKYNELNNSTYLSAIKKFRSYNQNNRSKNMENNLFREYNGREIGNYKITNISYGNMNTLSIVLYNINMPVSALPQSKSIMESNLPDPNRITYIIYYIDKDVVKYMDENENKMKTFKMNRSLANVISKIILMVNPNSKYISVNNFDIIGY